MSGDTCFFCGFAATNPELVIARGKAWSVFHASRRWPAGSLFIAVNEHVTFQEASPDDWATGAPVFAAAQRTLVEVLDASRTYVTTFQEEHAHFHFLMFAKTPSVVQTYGDAKAVQLLSAVVADARAFDVAEAVATAARLREPFARQLALAESEPHRRLGS